MQNILIIALCLGLSLKPWSLTWGIQWHVSSIMSQFYFREIAFPHGITCMAKAMSCNDNSYLKYLCSIF